MAAAFLGNLELSQTDRHDVFFMGPLASNTKDVPLIRAD